MEPRIQVWVQFFEKINLSSRTVPNIGPNSNSVSVTNKNQNQQLKPSKLGTWPTLVGMLGPIPLPLHKFEDQNLVLNICIRDNQAL